MTDLADLYSMIEAFLTERITFADFDGTFGFAFYELPVHVMRSEPATLASAVVEKLEFVTDHPTDAERAEGWIAPPDFVNWLRQQVDHRSMPPLSNER